MDATKTLNMEAAMTPEEVAEKVAKLPEPVQQRIMYLVQDAQLLTDAKAAS